MTGQPRDIAASVRARLLNISRQRQEDYQLVLMRYAVERLLYRLSRSEHRDRFILKGAMLYVLWGEAAYRPTRDLDLLGYGDTEPESIAACFREICAVDVPDDGIVFLADTVSAETIRDLAEHGGVRVRFGALLGKIQIPMQVDVGFGDAVVPEAKEEEFSTLIDGPAPRIRVYPREVVVAEKLHAMVFLGEANSRMKDFYDLCTFSRIFSFDGETLSESVIATFERQGTSTPAPTSVPLSTEFYELSDKAEQWRIYRERSDLPDAPADFTSVGEVLRGFATPLFEALADGRKLEATWQPGGPWR